MDSTTKMLVEKILNDGWYRKGQSLGEGGWSKIPDWNCYVLMFEVTEKGESQFCEDKIYAKDDETAIQAFESLYVLEDCDWWDIDEVITEYRLIASGENNL